MDKTGNSTIQTKKKRRFSRRKFLLRGGVVLGASAAGLYLFRTPIRRSIAEYLAEMDLPSGISDFAPLIWFEVQEDNTITLKSPKVEMGQGTHTGFAMLAAEELDVALEQIHVINGASINSAKDMGSTGGSTSTFALYEDIRKVAATMREMLKVAASGIMDIALEQLNTENGIITGGGKSMTYAAVVAQTTNWEIPEPPALRPPSTFKYVGKSIPRVDLGIKVMGAPIYAIDSEMPGMLYAITLESPFLEGTLKSVDISEAEKHPGVVKVINEAGFVAVVAKTRYAAEMAKRKLKAEWDVPKIWQQEDIDALTTVGNGPEVNIQKEGKAKRIIRTAGAEVITSEYRTPIGVHAQMEPDAATAYVQGDKVVVIGGTQSLGKLIKAVAEATGLPEENIEAHHSYLGGGFGGRIYKQKGADAARISQIMGVPIHAFNDRETEFMNSYYRPNNHHVMRAVLKDGQIEAIEHEQAAAAMYISNNAPKIVQNLMGGDFVSTNHGAAIFYTIPNRSTSIYDIKVPYHSGVWRAVGTWMNAFPIEIFMDELAHKLQQDPIALRLGVLKGAEEHYARSRKVVETARDKSGWNTPKADGVGRGFAFCFDRHTIIAGVAEVQLVNNAIKVTQFTHVTDCGVVVNPEGAKTQIEGCIMMGISAALYEEQKVKDGKFVSTNYHQYPMAMLGDTPEMEIILLEGRDQPSGMGEPPITVVAPAIANAVFDLTGQRLRNLPLKLA